MPKDHGVYSFYARCGVGAYTFKVKFSGILIAAKDILKAGHSKE